MATSMYDVLLFSIVYEEYREGSEWQTLNKSDLSEQALWAAGCAVIWQSKVLYR